MRFVLLVVLAALVGCKSSEPKKEAAPRADSSSADPQTRATGPSAAAEPKNAPPKEITTASGLRLRDDVVGTGPEAARGQLVTVHYRGTFTNGDEFDSSYRRDDPFPFRLGMGAVIKGWDEGVSGMRVGGKRHLVIPPQLAYGEDGRQGIPPNATLVFDVELLSVRP